GQPAQACLDSFDFAGSSAENRCPLFGGPASPDAPSPLVRRQNSTSVGRSVHGRRKSDTAILSRRRSPAASRSNPGGSRDGRRGSRFPFSRFLPLRRKPRAREAVFSRNTGDPNRARQNCLMRTKRGIGKEINGYTFDPRLFA